MVSTVDTRTPLLLTLTLTLALASLSSATTHGQTPAPWWSAATQQALDDAQTNRAELVRALEQVPTQHRRSLEFLLENMPARDRRSLSADFLLRHLALAHDALDAAPWRDRIPEDLFLNDILPYASLNETRDESRARLRELSAPLVKDCSTPAEAAQRLNRELFPLVKVRYSTERKRPDQSSLETMSSGKATCTGLAILLVDACRSVGVPARVAGTPMWTNMRGNHTWVEVWDGDWHFTGAAEPDPNGLDRGWFVHDAAQAKPEVPEHAIYASSFRQTGLAFPLVWAPRIKWVPAVNVTARYIPKSQPAPANTVRLLVKVLDAPAGRRVAVPVTLLDLQHPDQPRQGTSRSETADLNDILPFDALPGRSYRISAQAGDRLISREVTAHTNVQQVVTLTLSDQVRIVSPSQACYAPPPVSQPLAEQSATLLRDTLNAYFAAPAPDQASWPFPTSLDRLLLENEPAVRQTAWDAYRNAPIHADARADFDAHQVRFEQHLSPYTVKTVGTRPTNGWALVIAMHGGGNAPKRVNDSQWQVMQRYYHDHPEAGGYLYVALRAPNDSWNGFYDNYVYPLVANLVRHFLLFADVDPNKVFLIGYSHGGYGAFAIGPKMPDRFAAVHASAAAPTDGETTPKTLRHTVFSVMIGERDTAYGRIDRVRRFAADIQQLRGSQTEIYPVRIDIREGHGHSGLPDRDLLPALLPAIRNPVPRDLTWLMTDPVITDFFWLRVPDAAKGRSFWASCRDNHFVLTAGSDVPTLTLFADARLVDFSRPVSIELNGSTTSHPLKPSLKTLAATLARRGDPELAFTAQLEIRPNEEGVLKVVSTP